MPKGIYKRSDKQMKMLKESKPMLGKKHSKDAIMKIIKANKGKKLSEETKKKMSLSRKGFKMSEEQKKKISISSIGKIGTRLGSKLSEETKRKIGISNSISQRGKLKPWATGDKNWNWKGGISYQPYPPEWSDKLKELIRERDNYICQECGIHQDELKGFYTKLDIHHINYDKDNLEPKNLISLCRSCHSKTNSNRDFWKLYFEIIILTKIN